MVHAEPITPEGGQVDLAGLNLEGFEGGLDTDLEGGPDVGSYAAYFETLAVTGLDVGDVMECKRRTGKKRPGGNYGGPKAGTRAAKKDAAARKGGRVRPGKANRGK